MDCLPLPQSYIHVYGHNIQTSSSLKRPIKAKLYVEHHKEEGMKVYINGQGHITMVAAIAINSKNLKKILQNRKAYDFETWHEASGMKLYKVYINHEPGMNLTYFMARST